MVVLGAPVGQRRLSGVARLAWQALSAFWLVAGVLVGGVSGQAAAPGGFGGRPGLVCLGAAAAGRRRRAGVSRAGGGGPGAAAVLFGGLASVRGGGRPGLQDC